jgi:succinyl-diaminopimelate desuccinylase
MNEIKIAKDLVRFASVTPLDKGAINYVAKSLKKLGFRCKILEFKEKGTYKIKNLYAKIGTKKPHLCFAGHTDVVPIGDLKKWSVNPFGGQIKNGVLYGRGIADMKGNIASFISATYEFLKDNKNFNGSLSFLITGDEESVAINGTKKVVKYLKKKKEKIDFCLIGEPTNPNKLGEEIKIGRRGSITGYITISGIQGHVAYPNKARNPSTPLIKILNEIKNKKLDNGSKNFQASNLEIVKININNLADNVIPSKASAIFNIRYNDRHTSTSLRSKISKIIKKTAKKYKCKYDIKFQETGGVFLCKPNSTVNMIRNIIKKSTGRNTKLTTGGGTSDGRFIKDIAPCIEFGLVNKTIHQVNERVSIADLKKLKNIYKKILQNYYK